MLRTIAIQDLQFSDFLLLRTPVLSYEDTSTLASSLQIPLFRFAILAASSDLYRELQKAAFDYERLDVRSQKSLWKYWNRMRYRPTPFGLFAAVSDAYWTDYSDTLVTETEDLEFHVNHDFKKNQELLDKLASEDSSGKEHYILNPACYRIGERLRYIISDFDQGDSSRTFHICEAQIDEVTRSVIESDTRVALHELTIRLMQKLPLTQQECSKYLQTLIQAGILMPEINSQLNITGKDYLFRNAGPCIQVGSVQEFENDAGNLYINTERRLSKKGLHSDYKKQISDGLECLLRFSAVFDSGKLRDFKRAFVEKYDRQQVPLLSALDPEIGIGYNYEIISGERPSLLDSVCLRLEENEIATGNWTPAHSLLMKKWLQSDSKYDAVYLVPEDIYELPATDVTLPNSFSVLFRILNGRVVLEQGGGATATAMCGRFTPISKEIYNGTKKLAIAEEEANPQVIFAEICHIENLHSANIDRRENLYAYEIPILCGSVLDIEHQILLSDLSVSVIDDEVYLWSAKHNKRVIPRLSSAYNYARSELSLFRFLCDLQYEGLQTTLCLDLEQFFPNLDFYPRIVFKETIIHFATWVISETKINYMAALPPDKRLIMLAEIARSNCWPRFVSLNEYDHQLVFDTQNQDDLHQLSMQVKQDRRMLIKEFLYDEDGQKLVTDHQGHGFVNQFIASVYHDHEIYVNKPIKMNSVSIQRLFVPGSEWLYYKLYIHPAASNEILVENILKAVRDLRRQGLLKQWFFVRFKDPRYHLRVRLQLTPKHTGYALSKFVKVLEELAATGIIQKYSIDSYERELERYSPELIVACEDFFCASTMLIVESLEKITADESDYKYYYIAEISIRLMLTAFGLSAGKAADMFKDLYHNLAASIPKEDKKHNSMMKKRHRAIRKEMNKITEQVVLIKVLKKPLKLFETYLDDIAAKTLLWRQDRRLQLFSDLLHMHLNRLFVEESFAQEMILYYSYWRSLESETLR